MCPYPFKRGLGSGLLYGRVPLPTDLQCNLRRLPYRRCGSRYLRYQYRTIGTISTATVGWSSFLLFYRRRVGAAAWGACTAPPKRWRCRPWPSPRAWTACPSPCPSRQTCSGGRNPLCLVGSGPFFSWIRTFFFLPNSDLDPTLALNSHLNKSRYLGTGTNGTVRCRYTYSRYRYIVYRR